MQDYTALTPRTTNRSDGSFKKTQIGEFVSNHFKVQITTNKSLIFQYDYKLYNDEENIEIQKNSEFYYQAIKQLKQKLKQVLGYEIHRGQIIYCTKSQPIPLTIKCQLKNIKKPIKLSATFTKTKQFNLKDLNHQNTSFQQKQHLTQCINIAIKNRLQDIALKPLGLSGKYYRNQKKIIAEDIKGRNIGIYDQRFVLQQNRKKYNFQPILTTFQGFKMTLMTINNKFVLEIDPCVRIMQGLSLIQQLKYLKKGMSSQQINQQLTGKIVTTDYGNFLNYKILQVDLGKTPKSSFILGNGKQITYIDYYQQNYKIKIKDYNQPLIKVLLQTKKEINKNKIKQQQKYGYLIPELIYLAGLTEQNQKDKKVMDKISQIAKISPYQRISRCYDIIEQINQGVSIIKISKQTQDLMGFVMKTPTLTYGQGKEVKPDEKGVIRQLGKLNKAATVKNYLFVYSQSLQNPDEDYRLSQDIIQLLRKSSKIYGVEFKNPDYFPIKHKKQKSKPNCNDWIKAIYQDCQKNGYPNLIMFLLKPTQQKQYYGKLKQFCINEIQVPSQCMTTRTFDPRKDYKRKLSAASKLTIQISAKLGCAPWKVQKTHPFFKGKKVMQAGITTSKGKNGIYMSFVGSINDQATSYYGFCQKVQNVGIPSLNFQETVFKKWAKKYFINEKRVAPDVIILYREGLNQKQLSDQIQACEFKAIQNLIKVISKSADIQSYNPQWQIISVNKKINSRFFESSTDNKGNQKEINPNSGSFTIESLDNSLSFDLIPQYVTQGTSTPCRYRIVAENPQRPPIPQQALISLTYDQCFSYYNWQGAIRVPACLQYSSKLAKMASQHLCDSIKEEKDSKFYDQLYFL